MNIHDIRVGASFQKKERKKRKGYCGRYRIYMISDWAHHFTQAAPITPFLGTENIILGIITGGIFP